MKKVFLIVSVLLFAFTLSAQEAGKIRGGLDVGFSLPKGGGGFCYDLNLAYNITDNMNAGIRYGSAIMAKTVGEESAELSANACYLGTFNYYFNNGSSSFAPFVGAGMGYYALGKISMSDDDTSVGGAGKFGGLITAGFELSKLRFGVEYNLIPKTEVQAILGGTTTKVSNSYLAITIGFYLGGGKWKK
ncbi:MAG: Protein of unknown function precursor [Bacteroidetes bacterium]|jgi:outer membrane protein W|nr:Protein of unknown function precursor [Bacteroidota bacterium]